MEKPTPQSAPAKVEHKSIYAALSAFQGENPEIKKTKEFGKKGDKMYFWYAPLDEILATIRPLTSKHGLAFTWEEKDGKIVCALYHETYTREIKGEVSIQFISKEGAQETKKTPFFIEVGVLRSMPIEVIRKGEMKDVGSDSTYSRKYTLSEVLGLAPDEDNDARLSEQSQKNMAGFAFKKAKETIEKAEGKELESQIRFLEKELADAEAVEAGTGKKAPSLGLKAGEYKSLLAIARARNKKRDFSEAELDEMEKILGTENEVAEQGAEAQV